MNVTDARGPNRVSKSGPEFVVIGAGLAGLAAAGTLHRAGREVLVLEQNDAVGGRVRTDRQGGFLLDRGFQVLLTAYPELDRHLDLCALNLRPFLRGANVWDGDSFVELADPRSSFRGAFNGLRTSVLTHADRIRLLSLALRLRRSRAGLFDSAADQPMQQFLTEMKFSTRSIDAIWEPLFSGIQLTSSLEGSARLACLILRCLILGPAAVPAAGMQAIPEQMASNLPSGSMRLGAEVVGLDGTEVSLSSGEVIEAGKVLLATDKTAAVRLLGGASDGSRSQWHAYFRSSEPPNESKAIHLLPATQGPCRNVAIMSNVAAEYAPQDETLIVAAGPTSGREAPVSSARAQLVETFGAASGEWELLTAGVVVEAQPLFVPGMKFIRQRTTKGVFAVAGDHSTTPSIQGALVSGRVGAESLLES